jgi:hypothetical protein
MSVRRRSLTLTEPGGEIEKSLQSLCSLSSVCETPRHWQLTKQLLQS